tara:strand:- start:102 stop:428 length:327 start_codon:yes stop_codon:yes gene_type:complete
MLFQRFDFERFKKLLIKNLDAMEKQTIDQLNNMFDLDVVSKLSRYLKFKDGLVIYSGFVNENGNLLGHDYVLNTNKGYMRYWSMSDCIIDLFENHVEGLRPLEEKKDE